MGIKKLFFKPFSQKGIIIVKLIIIQKQKIPNGTESYIVRFYIWHSRSVFLGFYLSSAVFLAFTTVNSFEKRYFVDFLKNLFHLQMEALHCVNDECNFY